MLFGGGLGDSSRETMKSKIEQSSSFNMDSIEENSSLNMLPNMIHD